jgi:hypothetical protein
MPARIDDVTIKPVRLTPAEAELAVEVTYSPAPPACELHGRLIGPTCAYSTTVEVAYPIRKSHVSEDDPRKLIGRIVIPEPSWWDPDSPFLYSGIVELWEGNEKKDGVQVRVGLRNIKLTELGLIWNGHRLSLPGRRRDTFAQAEIAKLHGRGYKLIVVPANEANAPLWAMADLAGLLILGLVSSSTPINIAALSRSPSCLGWVLTIDSDDEAKAKSCLAQLRHSAIGQGHLVGHFVDRASWPLPIRSSEFVYRVFPKYPNTPRPIVRLDSEGADPVESSDVLDLLPHAWESNREVQAFIPGFKTLSQLAPPPIDQSPPGY